MSFTIESEREDDGRWLVELPALSGLLAYGDTREEALARAQILALRVLAEQLEQREGGAQPISIAVASVSGLPVRPADFSPRFFALDGDSNVSPVHIRH